MRGDGQTFDESYPISDVALLAALLARPQDTSHLLLVVSHPCVM